LTPKKGVNPYTRYPDAYYGRVAFDKAMFQGIELVAKIERMSKKKAARFLIEEGFRKYIGNKLGEAISDLVCQFYRYSTRFSNT
jgi:hypothetical protein